MSARITVIVYILICLEVGILLILLPWTPYWNDNFFFDFIRSKLHAPWLATLLQSGYLRGAVSGLGVVNILAGLRDAFKFQESVRSLTNWEISLPKKSVAITPAGTAIETSVSASSTTATSDLSDHQSPRIPPSA